MMTDQQVLDALMNMLELSLSDPQLIRLGLMGSLSAWASGLFIGIILKYINKLK